MKNPLNILIRKLLRANVPQAGLSLLLRSNLVLILLAFFLGSSPAYATKDFNIKNNSQSFLFVSGSTGNVGIGSQAPGQMLDVNGTVKATAFIGNGALLTGVPSSTVWTTTNTNDVYLPNSGNVGIGTTITMTAALSVMNGNVGIGTWVPAQLFTIGNNLASIDSSGNISGSSISAGANNSSLGNIILHGHATVWSNTDNTIILGGKNFATTLNTVQFNGSSSSSPALGINGANLYVESADGSFGTNLGIGTASPRAQLDVAGTLNLAAPFTVTSAGNVGIGTWVPSSALQVANGNINVSPGGISSNSSVSSVSTIIGGNGRLTIGSGLLGGGSFAGVYARAGLGLELDSDAVAGRGMVIADGSGNVGIGTFLPGAALDVEGTANPYPTVFYAHGTDYNVGIGSLTPGQALDVQGTVRATAFIGNGSALTGIGGMQWTTTNTHDVYLPNSGNVGLGTTITGGAALSVMNGNVGIGTWVPSQQLQVQGNGYISNVMYSTAVVIGGNSNGNPTFRTSSQKLVFYNPLNANSSFAISPIVNDTTGTSATVLLNTTGNSYLTGGNVGIGTTVPGAALDVEGTQYPTVFYGRGTNYNVGIGSLTPGQALDVTGTVRATAFVGNGAALTGLPFTSSQWTTTNTNDVYLPNSGNVGLGTTITGGGAALSIMNGNVGIGTWVPAQALDVNGVIRTGVSTMQSGTLTVSGQIAYVTNMYNVSSGSMDLYGGGTQHGGEIDFIAGSNPTNPGILQFLTGIAGQQTEKMRIDAKGNVGIGSTTPNGLLDVEGTLGNPAVFYATSSTSNVNVGIGSFNPGQKLDVTGTVRATAFIGNGSALTGIGGMQWTTTNINDVYLPNNGNVGLGTTITGGAALSVMNGNVGIGTWVPATALQVSGTITANNFNVVKGSTTSTIGYDNGTGMKLTTGSTYVDWADSINELILNSSSIINQGKVGIGTSTPQGGLVVMNGNVGIGTWIPNGGLIVASGVGNVGIGSLSPGQALDVTGTVRATAFVGNGSGLTGVPSSALWTATNTNDVYLPNNGNVGIGTIITNAGAAFSVMNGNVGIGTWVPDATLQVSGSIDFSQPGTNNQIVRMNNNNWYFGSDGAQIYIYNTGFNADMFSLNGNNSAPTVRNSLGYFWSSTGNSTALADTGFSRMSAGVIGLSSGTIGTSSGALAAGNIGIGTFNVAGGGLIVKTGNVGIGSLNPAGVLDVEGTISPIVFYATTATSSSNVGIGSFSPGQKLDVVGTLRATNFVGNGAGLTGLVGTSQWTTSNVNDVYLPNNGNVGIGTTITNAGAALSVMNGNVGIGTWVPATPLHILTTGAEIARFTTNDSSGATTAFVHFYDGNPIVEVGGIRNAGGGSSSYAMQLFTASRPLYFTPSAGYNSIFSTGNVGISSTAPGQALDVTGTVRATAFIGNGSALTGIGGMQWTTSNFNDVYLPNSGNVGIGTTITNSGAALSVMNGNVGIGTWVPKATLDVEGTVSTANFGGAVTGGSTGTFATSVKGGGSTLAAGTLAFNLPYLTLSTNGNTTNNGIVYSFSSGSEVATSGTTSIFQVGGSAAPTSGSATGTIIGYNLIPVENWTSGASNPGSYEGMRVNVTQTAVPAGPNYLLRLGTGGATFASLFDVQSNGNVGIGTFVPNGKLIVTGGNVGIGTLNPGQTLDVTGTVRATAFIGNGAGLTGISASQWTTTNTNDVYLPSPGNVGIGTTFTSSGAALTVMNGDVGIGTWVPSVLLDVGTGQVKATIFRSPIFSDQASTVTQSFYAGGTYQGGEVDSTGGNATTNPGILQFRTGILGNSAPQAEAARFDANGNLGIGTVSPVSRLNVNGSVGIGTSLTNGSYLNGNSAPSGGLIVQGNVGFGTYAPTGALEVEGNVGIGTAFVNGAGEGALTVMNGNVGIGTWVPGASLQVNNTMTFQSEYCNNSCSAVSSTFTVNWNNGNKQKVILGAAGLTMNFTAPSSGVTNLLLKIVQDGTGSRTITTWPAAVKWPSGSTPTLTTTASQEDVVTCYWDGTDYLCTAALNYTP